jgi:hypothetical protein
VRRRRPLLILALIAALSLAGAAPAQAQFPSTQSPPADAPSTPAAPSDPASGGGDTLAEAAAALRSNPVYVDPRAERAISAAEARRLRERISAADAGPLYLAILPESAADAAGGDPDQAIASLARRVDEPGTYVGLIGDALRAGATSRRILPRGEAGRLAADALRDRGDAGTLPVLLHLVDRIGRARADVAGGGSNERGGGGGGSSLLVLLLLLGVPALLLMRSRRRRRRQEEQELAELKEFARDDIIALGQDIRELDIDIEMPGTPPGAKADYARAVERYDAADDAWDQAGRPEDLERVTSLVEDGRHAIACVHARLGGRELPERRPPCFFDPRHGPSVEDVEWAPYGGAPRPVPVCAADAQRIDDGEDPQIRRVGDAPYWDAGPQYAPWATGFFGGGLVPGLFVGSMLGAGFGMFGSPFFGGGAWASPGDGGGGDFGDFGDGDFGGGGFGGGDFGGGDFGGGDFG